MITEIYSKIRSLVEDKLKYDYETFEYVDTNIFTLGEENIESIDSIKVNGEEIGTGDYTFNSTTNEITITTTGLAEDDKIKVNFSYYKYSNTELKDYIEGALVWISVYNKGASDYEIENNDDPDIYPTPDNRTEDLIALISAILINPDYTRYSLTNVTVVYNSKIPKDQKIRNLVQEYNMGLGINDVLEFD